MGRVWLAFGGSVLVLLCLIGVVARHSWKLETRLEERLKVALSQIVLLHKAQDLTDTTEANALAARKVQDAENQKRSARTECVLRDNGVWSGVVLPDDVIRLLRQGSNSNGTCTIPPPGDASR